MTLGMTESVARKKIRAEFSRRGYVINDLQWHSLGRHELFSGRAGGWWVNYRGVDSDLIEQVGGENWRDLVYQAFGEEALDD